MHELRLFYSYIFTLLGGGGGGQWMGGVVSIDTPFTSKPVYKVCLGSGLKPLSTVYM